MVAGLFVGAVLCVSADPTPPAMAEPHRDALARYGAAVWNLRRERLLTAARQFEAAVKQDPDATEPLKELAKLCAQLGREPEAIRAAQKVVAKDSADHETAALLARLLFDAGETKAALAAARLALESKKLPERPGKAVRTYRGLAALFEQAGDLAAASDALRKAVALVTDGRAEVVKAGAFTPKDADAEAADLLERLGRVLVKLGKHEAAADAFGGAAELYADPKRADDAAGAARLGWNLSGALQAAGEPARALAALDEFLKLKPQAPEPFERLAELLRATSRADEVAPTLKRHLARDPLNRPLAAVLAAELALTPTARAAADEMFQALTTYDAKSNRTPNPKVIAVVVRSHLDTDRALAIVADLDRSFALLDDKKDGAESAAARFAADKARAVADALAARPKGVDAVLAAAADDLRAGTKRATGTFYFLGALAAKHRKLDLAEHHFRQAALSAPRDARHNAQTALLNVLWQARRPDKVERVCRDALDGQGVQPFLYFHLSLALAEQGKAERALEAAEQCILQAGDGDRLTVRLNKHAVLRALGRWDAALEYGSKLLEEFDGPTDRQRVRYAQAGAYWAAGKPREAEALLRAVLDADPDDPGACNDLGYHLADQGRDLAEAERLVRHAITLDRIKRRKAGNVEPDSAAYRDSLGWVFFRQGKLPEARAELEAAAALPDGAADPTVWDHLGDVLFRSGEKAKAKAAWLKARELLEADGRQSAGRRDGRLDELKRKLARVPQ